MDKKKLSVQSVTNNSGVVMAKRFIDTKLWDKAWFRRLDPKSKLVWIYIVTKCDHAGVWDCDWEAASFFIGDKVNYNELPQSILEKMIPIESFKNNETQYFIPSFIEYQYGMLRENSKPHLSVIKRLTEKGLMEHLPKSILSLKDKEKEEVQSIDKREDKFKEEVIQVGHKKGYEKKMLDNFILYWTEKNPNSKKMRYEKQVVFDVGRRLATWNSRDFNKNKEIKNGRTKMQYRNS